MMISKGYIFYPIHVRKRMNRRMNGIYLGLFRNFPLRGFFSLTQDILGIQNQLSLLLLQFVQCRPSFWLKMTGLLVLQSAQKT